MEEEQHASQHPMFMKLIKRFQIQSPIMSIESINQRIILGCKDGSLLVFQMNSDNKFSLLFSQVDAHKHSYAINIQQIDKSNILSAIQSYNMLKMSNNFIEQPLQQPSQSEILMNLQIPILTVGLFDRRIILWDTSYRIQKINESAMFNHYIHNLALHNGIAFACTMKKIYCLSLVTMQCMKKLIISNNNPNNTISNKESYQSSFYPVLSDFILSSIDSDNHIVAAATDYRDQRSNSIAFWNLKEQKDTSSQPWFNNDFSNGDLQNQLQLQIPPKNSIDFDCFDIDGKHLKSNSGIWYGSSQKIIIQQTKILQNCHFSRISKLQFINKGSKLLSLSFTELNIWKITEGGSFNNCNTSSLPSDTFTIQHIYSLSFGTFLTSQLYVEKNPSSNAEIDGVLLFLKSTVLQITDSGKIVQQVNFNDKAQIVEAIQWQDLKLNLSQLQKHITAFDESERYQNNWFSSRNVQEDSFEIAESQLESNVQYNLQVLQRNYPHRDHYQLIFSSSSNSNTADAQAVPPPQYSYLTTFNQIKEISRRQQKFSQKDKKSFSNKTTDHSGDSSLSEEIIENNNNGFIETTPKLQQKQSKDQILEPLHQRKLSSCSKSTSTIATTSIGVISSTTSPKSTLIPSVTLLRDKLKKLEQTYSPARSLHFLSNQLRRASSSSSLANVPALQLRNTPSGSYLRSKTKAIKKQLRKFAKVGHRNKRIRQHRLKAFADRVGGKDNSDDDDDYQEKVEEIIMDEERELDHQQQGNQSQIQEQQAPLLKKIEDESKIESNLRTQRHDLVTIDEERNLCFWRVNTFCKKNKQQMNMSQSAKEYNYFQPQTNSLLLL